MANSLHIRIVIHLCDSAFTPGLFVRVCAMVKNQCDQFDLCRVFAHTYILAIIVCVRGISSGIILPINAGLCTVVRYIITGWVCHEMCNMATQ